MRCALCNGNMMKGYTNLPYEIDGNFFLVVKDVPAMVCNQCGESFVDIEVVRVVEKIVEVAKNDGVTLGIVKYKTAA